MGYGAERTDNMITCELWTYDVWGNADDGYEVNDRHCITRSLELPDFEDDTILAAIRKYYKTAKDNIDIDGDDMTAYMTQISDGYPLCELIVVGL